LAAKGLLIIIIVGGGGLFPRSNFPEGERDIYFSLGILFRFSGGVGIVDACFVFPFCLTN